MRGKEEEKEESYRTLDSDSGSRAFSRVTAVRASVTITLQRILRDPDPSENTPNLFMIEEDLELGGTYRGRGMGRGRGGKGGGVDGTGAMAE